MDAEAKVTDSAHHIASTSTTTMTVETPTTSAPSEPPQPANGATALPTASDVPAPVETATPSAPAVEDEAMKEESDDGQDAAESESEEESESSDDDEEEASAAAAPPVVALTDANGRPLSDIEIAAQYAAIEIQSMSSQFASAVVDATKPAAAPIVPVRAANGNSATDTAMKDDDDDDDDDDDEDEALGGGADAASSGDEDSSDDEGIVAEDEDPRKLRAEIEAAMEKEENKVSGPLKTANEVAAVPVREPDVKELTPDCPIARMGVVLNVSRPGLIVTIKSDHGIKPLDEGSVLCLEDRTVLGCVDEVFGPVLMPMYLVRFESAEKIPAQTDIAKPVFFATEHTTYIIPDNIRDKGTDASNIFDEETDETIYSDDEAEAAAKRQNRKRNRGGDNAAPVGSASAPAGSGPTGNFTDYQGGRHHGGGGRGRGRGRGAGRGSGGPSAYGQQHHHQHQHSHAHAAPVQIQAQPHGGVTRYTTGYGQPAPQGYPPAPGQYGGAQAYGGAPAYQQGGQYAHPPPPPMPMYGQPPFPNGQHLPPYPPQAPPPNYYAQQPGHGYAQPPPPPPGHYGPPAGYYQQPNPHAYGQQGHHHPPPPPPPSGGPYGPPGGRTH